MKLAINSAMRSAMRSAMKTDLKIRHLPEKQWLALESGAKNRWSKIGRQKSPLSAAAPFGTSDREL